MMKQRYNIVLLLVMAFGVLCSLWLNLERHAVEQRNNSVEIAMEYEGLRNLSDWENIPLDKVLQDFKSAGVTSLIIFDTTLQKLNADGLVTTVTGEELLKAKAMGSDGGSFAPLLQSGVKLNQQAVYITAAASQTAFAELKEDLALRFAANRIKTVNAGPEIIELLGNPMVITEENYDTKPGLMQTSLGLPTHELTLARKAGFNVIIRPQNYLPISTDKIDSMFARIDRSQANVVAYIGCGREIVGFPNELPYMAEQLLKRAISFGMVEHYTQLQFSHLDGLLPLAEQMQYRVARTYIIDKAEQRKLRMPEALRRWALTDEERNIRINYIKPFMIPQDGKDIYQLNLDYVKGITDDVHGRDYTTGTPGVFSAEASTYKPYFPEPVMLLPAAWAVVAGVILYLSLLFDFKKRNLYLLLELLGIAVSIVIINTASPTMRQILAFAAATVFPVLSMTVLIEFWESRGAHCKCVVDLLLQATLQLGIAIAMSLTGAALLSALLADSRFFLEIDIYRGVKLTFIMPILLLLIWYMKRFNVLGKAESVTVLQSIRHFLAVSINVRHLFILGFLAFVAYIFVGRSGHTSGVPVPAIELKMRFFLEQVMYARPREKEFVIGHPAFYLAVMAAYYKAPRLVQMPLAIAALIGQASLVQTFAHMRTPVIMSFVRALDGYLLGAVLGIIGIIFVSLLLPYAEKWQRRYWPNE